MIVIESNLIIGEHIKSLLLKKGYDVHDHVFTHRDKAEIYIHRKTDYFIVNAKALDFVTDITSNWISKPMNKIIAIKSFGVFESVEPNDTKSHISYIDKPFIEQEIIDCIGENESSKS